MAVVTVLDQTRLPTILARNSSRLSQTRLPTILCDVDGVCADLMTPWLAWYNARFDDALTQDAITKWDLHECVKPECGSAVYDFLHFPTAYDAVLPVPGALNGVNTLRAMGYRVVFVTSTNRHQNGVKLSWLERHGFLTLKHGTLSADYVECHDKSLVRGDVLIDDGLHNIHAFNLSARGVADIYRTGILFDAPWNRVTGDVFAHRAHGWSDVPFYVRTVVEEAEAYDDAEAVVADLLNVRRELIAESDRLRSALRILIGAKDEKEQNGKTDRYHKLAFAGWSAARSALRKSTDSACAVTSKADEAEGVIDGTD